MMLKLSCKEAITLMEKRHASGLSFKEKVQLAVHKGICDACHKYERFSAFLEKALSRNAPPPEDARLSDECKQRIIKSIQQSK